MERRAVVAFEAAAGNRLVGYAAVFDVPSKDLGGFVEYVKPGAFARTLRANPDVVALVHHKPEFVLGRTRSGTLRLAEDQKGLRFELDLPDTSYGNDLRVAVDRGDIAGASFAFTVPPSGDRWTERQGKPTRELMDVDLHDITITSTPAYPDTEVARRALAEYGSRHRVANLRRFLETTRGQDDGMGADVNHD